MLKDILFEKQINGFKHSVIVRTLSSQGEDPGSCFSWVLYVWSLHILLVHVCMYSGHLFPNTVQKHASNVD